MDLKVKGLRTKHLFREALAPWLPPAIVNRPKRGFNPPVEFWLQQHLADYAREHRLMETLAATGYFNLATVQAMADAHIGGRRDFGKQLWALLVFAIWWARVRGRGEGPS
jgi:asparagine synthase (glutamine-hydrolysing)